MSTIREVEKDRMWCSETLFPFSKYVHLTARWWGLASWNMFQLCCIISFMKDEARLTLMFMGPALLEQEVKLWLTVSSWQIKNSSTADCWKGQTGCPAFSIQRARLIFIMRAGLKLSNKWIKPGVPDSVSPRVTSSPWLPSAWRPPKPTWWLFCQSK